MALIDINTNPSKGELLFFGTVFPIFFGVLGAVVYAFTASMAIPQVIWSVAAVVTLLFALIKALRVPIYLGWIYLAFPIGWTVSHLLMLVTYYLVLTPFALVLKLIGRDTMKRGFEPESPSYFIDHPKVETSRYFKQF